MHRELDPAASPRKIVDAPNVDELPLSTTHSLQHTQAHIGGETSRQADAHHIRRRTETTLCCAYRPRTEQRHSHNMEYKRAASCGERSQGVIDANAAVLP
jgi:hypothetical protein